MSTTQYKVNLANYLAACEANYWRLLKLLPSDQQSACFSVQLANGQSSVVAIKLQEQHRYTTMISLEQHASSPLLSDSHFEIRLYHDAMLAEVTAFQQHKQIQPRYRYPNKKMYQQDEKWQQNLFLSELLVYCLNNGLAVVEPVTYQG